MHPVADQNSWVKKAVFSHRSGFISISAYLTTIALTSKTDGVIYVAYREESNSFELVER